jgi:DNA-directed RNA polymerase specialized sigma24 family protein
MQFSKPSSHVRPREEAFNALFRSNYAGLRRFMARLVGTRSAAENIVQDVFSYIWERYERIMRVSVVVFLHRTLKLGTPRNEALKDLHAIWDPLDQ